MSYRDDQEAARHRLESLEEKLAERDAELEQHKHEIADRDREISRLAHELRGAGTARIVMSRRNSGARFMVAGAMSAALVAGLLGFVSVHRTTMAPAVTFAELPPPMMPLAAPRLDVPRPALTLADPIAKAPDPSVSDEERAEASRLIAKVASGNYSAEELRRASQLCQRLGKNCGRTDESLGKRRSQPPDL
jgi:hypothetical protein